ncbi:MAG: hypothetical protein IK099_05420 [Clostridia bacterium]|nr:hypothetical protein [Clostridia bacterium]
MSSFESLLIVDKFYQTSLFFPMPTVIISTLCEGGTTNPGPYSLVQPYYVAGKDYYATLLCCRNSSNTAQNIQRNGSARCFFINDDPKTFKEAVKLSWPGEYPASGCWRHACGLGLYKAFLNGQPASDKELASGFCAHDCPAAPMTSPRSCKSRDLLISWVFSCLFA